ncbi:hypothetical protein [Streptomyces sp. NPDC048196]|uniref:hypothetical protein n=1 Tax=Streptomyces sp. NPDC048196 TaxID=3154712 RepID=UPI0033DA9342
MPQHFASIGEAIGSAMAHNARMAADLAAAHRLAEQPPTVGPTPTGGNAEDCPRCTGHTTELARDCPACEAGIPHTEHCPTPETHNWGCGCPTDAMRQDTGQDVAPGPSSYPYLDTLGVLLSRMVRGVLLEAERPLLREHVEHLLTDRSRSEHAASRLMEQRQELAEERYAWQERGDRAEAALRRVRAECDAIEAERARVDEPFGDGMVDATARVRIAIAGPAADRQPAPCPPGGGCTLCSECTYCLAHQHPAEGGCHPRR